MNILTDISILVMPLCVIKHLNLARTQKAGLYILFSLGFLVCLISVLRLHSVGVAAKSTVLAWDNVKILQWSSVEMNAAIICPSLATLKPLFVRLFPGHFRTIYPSTAHHRRNVTADTYTRNPIGNPYRASRIGGAKTANSSEISEATTEVALHQDFSDRRQIRLEEGLNREYAIHIARPVSLMHAKQKILEIP
ncbi:hypothetical protein BGZ60DRAFT_559310 [Tricladium varicosporioides]|nr:hypothetical protein BGZ60DRAFT_559310 [Hymenoscyphus varicosporioides]